MPQPYYMVSSLQPPAVQSLSSFAFHFRIVHQLTFATTILLLFAVVYSMSHLVIRQQHTGIPCYWQILVVKTKVSEVLKEVDYTQHNLHSVSSNTTSSYFAFFIFCLVCCSITDSAVSLFDINALDVYKKKSYFSVIFVSVASKIALPSLSRPAFL
jgi:uncharacterized membrane protein